MSRRRDRRPPQPDLWLASESPPHLRPREFDFIARIIGAMEVDETGRLLDETREEVAEHFILWLKHTNPGFRAKWFKEDVERYGRGSDAGPAPKFRNRASGGT